MHPSFVTELEAVDISEASTDHTYKIANFVKTPAFVDEEAGIRKQVKQFESCLFILGKSGLVRSFCLTRSECLDHVEIMLFEVFSKKPPEIIYTGELLIIDSFV